MDNVTRLLMQSSGGKKDSTYVDDVFSTYLYKGNNGNTLNINNGIDLAGEGGMTWIKCRDTGSTNHSIYDTVRGASELLWTNSDAAQMDQTGCGSNKALYQFNNNGFTLGGDCNGSENWDQKAFSSWSFRKQKGFFDIVTYTGNGSTTQNISHSLGSMPGMIIVKRTSAAEDWTCWHKGFDADDWITLNSTAAKGSGSPDIWNNTLPTSTQFSVGNHTRTNGSGTTYVAYLFAGGESTAATACSVHFDGSNDYLYTSTSSSDVSFGTGDFTIELWFRYDGTSLSSTIDTLIDTRNGNSGGTADHGWNVFVKTDGKLAMFTNGSDGNGYAVESNTVLSVGQWYHAAITRSGNTYRLFLNGVLDDTNTQSTSADAGSNFYIGYKANYPGSSFTYWNGLISNVRILKGTALYTSSFKVPTEPLTNITNTKFLWAQSSTVTTGTVNPMTLTNSGTTASTDSPFDDPEGFKFGEEGDQNLIKCGSYVGQSGANTVNLGWEPQWVMVKNIDSAEPWVIMDSMRGWVNQSSGAISLRANSSGSESAYGPWGPTSTGWELDLNQAEIDQNEKNYIYIAIRRPDGYVAKPVEAGTESFAMDTGNNSSTIPAYDSGFIVDMAFHRQPASSSNWLLSNRITGNKYLVPNLTNAESDVADFVFDSNTGWVKSYASTYQSWMWQRGQGFDVVTYKGNGTSPRNIRHNLGRPPEMIWSKGRNSTYDWKVWHMGLNGGSNAATYNVSLNTDGVQGNNGDIFGGPSGVLPTSEFFTTGGNAQINQNGTTQIAMLFASVEGISKVGYHTGDGTTRTFTCGFAPRLLIIKNITTTYHWFVLDTVRGWGPTGSTDKHLQLNRNNAQGNWDFGAPTSTGFTLTNSDGANASGEKYIWYAHA